MDEGFQYVVERKAQDHVCFLSSKERPNAFKVQCQSGAGTIYMPQSTVDKILNKVRSKRGVGGLASQVPRFPRDTRDQVPGPTQYNLKLSICRDKGDGRAKCLGGSGPRIAKHKSTTPGPGTYETSRSDQKFRIKKTYSFGGTISIIPIVETRCIANPVNRCAKCNEICTGDYWQRDSSYLCVPCMRTLWKKKPTKNLENFKRVRDCSFMHQHEGTTAAICLRKRQALFTRFAKESYFDVYFASH